MADLIRKMQEGHTVEDLDTVIDEVYEARGEYDSLDERLDDMEGGAPTPSTSIPAMDGTGSAGTSNQYARADHVHPSDTSKQDTLNAAQLAAVNSGITSEGVAQIETNKNNILLLEQANGSKNQINIPNGTYVAGTSSFSASGGVVTSTATDNITHAVDLSVWTLKAGTYVFFDDSSDLSAVQYRIYQQSPDTRLTPAGQNPATFTIANDTVVYISCYTFKTGTMTTRPMLVPKTMWDAGFTDYQPYAMSNAELTAAIQALQAQLANQ